MRKKLAISWKETAAAIDNARAVLPPLASEYFRMGSKAAAAGTSEEKLHGFRLATKRFRYTLEMFVPLYGPGLESRLKQVRRVQQVLGELQDCQVICQLKPVQEHERLLRWVQRRLERKKAEFRRLWNSQFAAPAVEQNWVRYLRRNTRERGA